MSLLSKAQECFNLGLYEQSLQIYEEYANSNNSNKIDVRFNINLCKSRLSSNGTSPNNLEHKDKFNQVKLNELPLLQIDLLKNYANNTINQNDLFIFFDKLRNNRAYEIKLDEMVKVLIHSPFQIGLLLLCGHLIVKSNQKHLFESEECKPTNLIGLIRSVIDYKYWLDNQNDILSLMDNLNAPKGGKFLGENFKSFNVNDILELDTTLNNIKTLEKNSTQTSFNDNVRLSIGSILLNESKFVGLNLINHYNICDEWLLVEGACQGYPTRKVTQDGLSLDNSALQIMLFPDKHNKIKFIQYGWTKSTGEDAKSELRNQYLKYARGRVLLVLDIDEFYSESDVNFALKLFDSDKELTALTLPQVHFWKGTKQFITGGYYDISHTRFFKNIFGMKYISNHNFPELNHVLLNKMVHKKEKRVIKEIKNGTFKYEGPRCYHMGFSKDEDDMRDKTDYYINRGEATTRKNTTDSRAGWFTDELPKECLVRNWGGNTPKILSGF